MIIRRDIQINRNESKKINLLGYGIDSELASKLILEGYGVTKIKNASIGELATLFGDKKAKEIKNAVTRKAVPDEIITRLIIECDWKCCICWNVEAVRPVIVHHIEKYSKTQNNSYENLVVLCPNHHADAHSKSELTGALLPAELIREKKQSFSNAIAGWREGNRNAPGQEKHSDFSVNNEPKRFDLKLSLNEGFYMLEESGHYGLDNSVSLFQVNIMNIGTIPAYISNVSVETNVDGEVLYMYILDFADQYLKLINPSTDIPIQPGAKTTYHIRFESLNRIHLKGDVVIPTNIVVVDQVDNIYKTPIPEKYKKRIRLLD